MFNPEECRVGMFEVPKRVLCKQLLALPDDERSGHSFPLSVLTPCLEVPNMDRIRHHMKERKLVLYHISIENPAINHACGNGGHSCNVQLHKNSNI